MTQGSLPSPRILSVATALPPHIVTQQSVRSVVQGLFPDIPPHLARVLAAFDHSHIARRHFVRPVEWYAEQRSFQETNDVYEQEAIALATQAAERALAQANVSAADISAIVVASTTGMSTPSLDSYIIQRLGMNPRTARLPIVGLGCAAGVSGLARAAETCTARGGAPVLFIAVEICSVTFQRNDLSKSNLVGTSLFADGAAAVVLAANGNGLRVRNAWSELFPDTRDIMGWDVVQGGLRVRFSRDIPSFVEKYLPRVVSDACTHWGVGEDTIDVIVAHPGGAKVLDAYSSVLQRPATDFDIARDVLHGHGNMSSPSVLFVLERTLQQWPANAGRAMMMALGPGFSAELVLLERA